MDLHPGHQPCPGDCPRPQGWNCLDQLLQHVKCQCAIRGFQAERKYVLPLLPCPPPNFILITSDLQLAASWESTPCTDTPMLRRSTHFVAHSSPLDGQSQQMPPSAILYPPFRHVSYGIPIVSGGSITYGAVVKVRLSIWHVTERTIFAPMRSRWGKLGCTVGSAS